MFPSTATRRTTARHTARTAAALAAAVAVTGPGAVADAATAPRFTGQTLTVLTFSTTTAAGNDVNSYIARQFTQETGAKVQYEYYTSTSSEQSDILTSATAHTGPDVFNLGFTEGPTAYATHAFVVLTKKDWAQLGGPGSIIPVQLTTVEASPGQYIGVPDNITPHAMLYNTALFKQAQISSPPATWTAFVQDAKKITALGKGIYGTALDPSDPYDPWKIIWSVAAQDAGHLLSGNKKTVLLDSPKSVNAFQFYFNWYTKWHIVPPQSLTWQNTQEIAAFAKGEIGMVVNSSTSVDPELDTPTMKGKYAFAPTPSVPYGMTALPKGGVPAETLVSGQVLTIPKYANLQLALDYVRVATRAATELYVYKTDGFMPDNLDALHQMEHAYPATKPFAISALGGLALPFSSASGDIEVGMDAALPKIAAKIATTGSASPAFITSVLKGENKAVQQELNSAA